uniref:Thiol:disulfide interchange protein DsbD n=1 Tax=Candidatus Kentrum sp. SD TaxID=2126332 RepID=A0A451BM76_9GAMM|nr:MAG: thiol:disulfide interchange protein DsbD [Candidatus Kentron sp. SD]VFK46428.1 MAG: thiol:disulfide interchange protein DsbD [Candidatus Kentron sp. SD]VFK79399.1 MAG: thiol:disulfide interchange protein DsbD [Candidatus Kentron sp. SD]
MVNHRVIFGVKGIGDATRRWACPLMIRNGPMRPLCLFVLIFALAAGGMFPVFASGASPAPSGDSVPSGPEDGPLSGLFSRVENRESSPGGDLLPPEEAFPPPFLEVKDQNTLRIRWRVTKGYYLYRDRFRFRIEGDPGVKLGTPRIPRGVFKEEEDSGRVEVFFDGVEITLPLVRHGPEGDASRSPPAGDDSLPARGGAPAGGKGETTIGETTVLALVVGYQGCAEAGLCYPPFTKTLPVDLAGSEHGIPAARPAMEAASGMATGKMGKMATTLSEPDRLARAISGNSPWVVLPIFFGFGLLLGFTPCVFPMIPILASIVAGRGKAITTGKALALSVVYVLAMAITYTVAGVIAGLFGHNLQAMFQNPWIITAFSAIFVLLALSMFDLFRIQVPTGWQTKLAMRGNLQQGGTFAGVGAMGLLSALIVGPCVAPPLAGALIAIGSTGDPIRGGLALFSLGMGMGAPLIALGTSAGRWLPKAGPWMRVTNHIFGVLLLAVAIYLLERILPGWIGMFLWAVLCIMIGVHLGALERVGHGEGGWPRSRKGMGIIALVYGIMLMVGAGAGLDHRFTPLKGFIATGEPARGALPFQRIETPGELRAKLAALSERNSARADAGQLTMLEYYADWCTTCKELETRVFSDPGVRRVLAEMVLLRADVTDNDEQDRAMLRMFGLYGPPAILFFGPDGREYPAYRVQGFMNAKRFREHVKRIRDALS